MRAIKASRWKAFLLRQRWYAFAKAMRAFVEGPDDQALPAAEVVCLIFA